MSNRAYGGDVTAQEDHRQRRDIGNETEEARDGSCRVETVEPVQQDDRHRTTGGLHLLGEARKPVRGVSVRMTGTPAACCRLSQSS